jgi:hypothetical protein
LEGDDGRDFAFEFLGGVQNGTVSADGDDKVYKFMVLGGNEFMADEFGVVFYDFVSGSCICEIIGRLSSFGDVADCFLDQLKDLLLFEDSSHHEKRQFLTLHIFFDRLL